MSATVVALLGYIGVMLVLLLILAGLRVGLTVMGKAPASGFAPGGDDVSPFSTRLCRAHANSYEFFPIVGGLLLYGLATGQSSITNGLAIFLLGARVLQSITHLASSSAMAVRLRFAFFLVQFLIAGYWLYLFFMASGENYM